MSKKIIGGAKDENGIYNPSPQSPPSPLPMPNMEPAVASAPSKSIDAILQQQLAGLESLTKQLVCAISKHEVTKDTAQQLATLIRLTIDLKAKENELLDTLTDDELKKLADE